MDSRTQERVERWDSRPFTGGYNELSTLADNGFSGVVTASETWLFMLNGRVVGVVDGEIEAFEQASGTIYAAPHASLPLLCSMHAQGGDTRANYYTNDTPLTEVDQTLQDGSFTGYIELSEQVLSGDYYAVYYGGRRMAAAYIGNAERLLTGDEAFERAADEVGIYEVVDVKIDVTDVPESSETASASTTPDSGSREGAAPQPPANSNADPAEESTPPATDGSATGAETTETIARADASSSSPESTADPDPDEWADSSDEAVSDDATRPASASELRETSDLTDLSGANTADSQPGQESATNAPDHSSAVRSHGESEVTDADAGRTEPNDADESPGQQSSRSSAPEPQSPETASDPDERSPSSDPDATSAEPSSESEPSEQVVDETKQSDSEAQSGQSESVTYDEDEEHDEAVSESEENGELDARLKQEERWRETRSIPSIDPENSEHVEAIRQQSGQQPPERPQVDDAASNESNASESRDRPTTDASTATEATQDSTAAVEQETTSRSSAHSPVSEQESVEPEGESLEAAIDEYEQRIETLTQHARDLESRQEVLETENANLESEHERLQAENQELTATVERLQSKIEDLEAECERLRNAETVGAGETAGFGGQNSERQLSAHEALAGTNLFVRYASKSDSTLQSAHGGDGDQESVASNLQLEQHTSFDASDVTVAGRPYEEFLTDTIEYTFVDWLVETLLFEIRDTGHGNGLADLYDAIPQIDRAELHATISLEDDETEDVPEEVTFDVVAFDKMGNPLIVANLNDSRDPATERMLAELEEAASAVTANYPDLGAAMVVTSSYFEPGALEVTEQATSSGFLSRGSKLSYVNLSRKQGYHLALVESRSGGFHMNVPEL